MFTHLKYCVALTCALLIAMELNAQAQQAGVGEKPALEAPSKQAKEVEPQVVKLAEGKLSLPVPGEWKVVEPRSRIIQHEFAVASAESDENAGRMTIMSAGGGVQANIDRWVGQFKSPAGGQLADDAKKISKQAIGDLTVHLVDLTGDFQDSPRGPFGPKVNRPGYRMLAAIIPLENGGTWFIKFYGPQATIKTAEKSFTKMIQDIKYAP